MRQTGLRVGRLRVMFDISTRLSIYKICFIQHWVGVEYVESSMSAVRRCCCAKEACTVFEWCDAQQAQQALEAAFIF